MKKKNDRHPKNDGRIALLALLALASTAGHAQAPDAGRLLQERQAPPAAPHPSVPLRLHAPSPLPPAALPGGARLTVRSIRVEGVTVLTHDEVLQRLGPVQGQEYDLAGMRALAARVQQVLRDEGLTFARAFLPPQDLAGGVLRIGVVEGRYGSVRAVGTSGAQATPFLGRLRPGALVEGRELERSLLLLQELPGVQATAVLRPGGTAGEGDLAVDVSHRRRTSGEIGLDNHGNRFSGRGRLRGALDVDSPLAFGDQFQARGYLSQEGTWLGSLFYQAPIGGSGLQGQALVSRTDYELGKEFAAAGAHGTADVLSAALAYPVLRSQLESLRVAGGVQVKRLHDLRDAASIDERKRSWLVPLTVSADRRDAGGVTWGSATLTFGRLDLDDALAAVDRTTARTEGHFRKLNIDVARHQALDRQWTLRVRGSAQWASRNLDSSEKFILGGPFGVRAWPNGEGSGDSGWMGQAELRYRWQWLEPYLLLETSRVRVNRRPWAAGDNQRSLHGAGLGVRWQHEAWVGEASLAWRVGGNRRPLTEPGASQPMAWVSVGYRF